MSANLSHLSGKKGMRAGIFRALVARSRQHALGRSDFRELSQTSLFGTANLYGTASFYDYLRPEEAGIQVRVCSGTCCELAGTQPALKAAIAAHVPAERIGHAVCLGRCYENASFQVGDHNFSGKTDVAAVFAGQAPPQTPIRALAMTEHQFLTGQPLDLPQFMARLDGIFATPAAELLHEIDVSGLRGRGGAGFPLARKLAACQDAVGETKFVVCNGDEGDPGAFSDRYLLEQQPYLVLLGMAIAARIVGADAAIVYIRAEYPEALAAIESAIAALEAHGLDHDLEFIAVAGAGSYVCGEETALLSSLEGQRPEVRVRPPFPVVQGLFLQPTVVSNVESLACLPGVVAHGAVEFSKCGSARSTGTKLVCLDGTFVRPGVYEVPMGTPLAAIIDGLGGGTRIPVKAFQIGGPLGGIVPVAQIADLHLDFESLHDAGFLLGHASIVGIPEHVRLIDLVAHLFAFAAAESCGKCYPCRIGTQRGLEMVNAAATAPIDPQLFDDLLETLEIGSLCALGGGLPLPIRNLLTHFPAELAGYFQGGQP